MNRELSLNDNIVDVLENNKTIFSFDCEHLFFQWQSEMLGIDIEAVRREYNNEDSEIGSPEGIYASINGKELFVGITCCADQAGILGIIDIETGELLHTQEAAYYRAGLSTEQQVFVLCLIYHYGICPFYQLSVMDKGNKNFHDFGEIIDLPEKFYVSPYNDIELSFDGDYLIINDDEKDYRIEISKWRKS